MNVFKRTSIQNWVLALLSGLLLTASFPKLAWYPLAWLAWVPLLMAIRSSTWGESFRLGFSAGLVHYLSLLYWMVHTMHHYGHLPLWQCVPILVLMAAYLATYTGLLCAWVNTRPASLATLVLFPVVGVALEYVRAHFLTGFPWELLGYSQFRHLPMIQIADILGVYGVSALVFLVNAGIAFLLMGLSKKTWRLQPVSAELVRWVLPLLALALAATWGYGHQRLKIVSKIASDGPRAKIAVIQGNIDQAQKWDPAYQRGTIAKYNNLSRQAVVQGADLIIWPETATPFYLFRNPELSNLVLTGIRATGTDFLVGSPAYSHTQGVLQLHNSAYLIDKDANLQGSYEKVHLVPFGEYVPFKRWMPFLGKLVAEVGDFKPGLKGTTLDWEGGKLGPLICYEIIVPPLARAMAAEGAHLLVSQTNDAWFGRTSAPFQHFSMGVFRAVENRRSLVRSANTGISGYIDATGEIIEQTGLFEDRALTRSVALLDTPSVYTRVGDLFAKICLVLTAVNLLWPLWVRRSRARKRQ